MKERENQLRQELKEIDIFLDRGLRKRDQSFDETIKQRDLEGWKELEQRETEWREVIRDRMERSDKSQRCGLLGRDRHT